MPIRVHPRSDQSAIILPETDNEGLTADFGYERDHEREREREVNLEKRASSSLGWAERVSLRRSLKL